MRGATTSARRRARLAAAALALAAGLLLAPAASAQYDDGAPDDFQIGFSESLLSGPDSGRWAARTSAAGADAVRISFYWSNVATEEPEHPRNPADPAYDFAAVDRAVRAAASRDLDVLMTAVGAPAWAEGPNRPPVGQTAPAGTWRPDPEAFGDFAHALAERYSGDFADPTQPLVGLPEVDLYSAWNEPNISQFLTPQYVNGGNASAAIYVRLLNAFAEEVERVNPDARIATGGTAPFGDPDGERRTPPLEFWRRALCLDDDLEEDDSCPVSEPARFDLLAHHPITFLSSPSVPASRPDDVTAADFGRLGDVLEAAEEEGTIAPGPHGLIVPEIWWETKPPQPGGISLRRQARYTSLALFLLHERGAEGVWFLQMRDSPRSRGESRLASYQTGIYSLRGRKKPALRAVRFPFVSKRTEAVTVRLWGRAPAGGRLRVEVRRRGGHWRRLAAFGVRAGEIFDRRAELRGPALLRARVGGVRSLTWRQRR